MDNENRSVWLRYTAAVLMTGLALIIKLILVPLVAQDTPFLLFFAAVIASAAFGGLGPGILSIILAAIFNNYFFMPPFGSFGLNSDQWMRLMLFVVEGIFVSIICARLNSARERAVRSETEARDLERRILEISDAEQRRIGHDLHDGLGQHLTGISLMTRRLQKHLTDSQSPDAQDASQLSELAKTAVEWTHDLCRTLSPPVLESDGLPEALRELAANSENIFKIDCHFKQTGEIQSIALPVAAHLYRIAQEALSNAIKHGHAKQVQIFLESAYGRIAIKVIDDGRGINPAEESHDGMGLRIMRYRARMIGASIDISGSETGGTIVTCRYWPDADHSNQSDNGKI